MRSRSIVALLILLAASSSCAHDRAERQPPRDSDVAVNAEFSFFGRLVDAEALQPISGGEVSVKYFGSDEHDEVQTVRSDAGGHFHCRVLASASRYGSASYTGFVQALFPIERDHDRADRELQVRLQRGASLELVVRDARAPIAGVRVDVATAASALAQDASLFDVGRVKDVEWTARTDDGGRATIDGLAVGAPLRLRIAPPSGARRDEARPVVLEAGERRNVEIIVGSGATLVGRLEDGHGDPIPEHEVWRVVARRETADLLSGGYDKASAVVTTDHDGRFRFDDVPPGTWWVAPTPENAADLDDSLPANDVPALAQAVVVESGAQEVDLVLRVERGLFIRGRVADPSGKPVAGCNVAGQSVAIGAFVNTDTDDDGEFELGPLPTKEWLIIASPNESFAESDWTEVAAGASDVVLQLQPAGSIAVRIAGGLRAAREYQVSVFGQEGGFAENCYEPTEGAYLFDDLPADTYSVCARSRSGQFGRRAGVELNASALDARVAVEVTLSPGRLRSERPEPVTPYAIFVDGEIISDYEVTRGSSQVEIVPPGEIEVRWDDGSTEGFASQHLTIAAGQEREITLKGKR